MSHVIGQVIGVLLAPLMLVLWIALAALALRFLGRPRAGRVVLICATALAYLFSIPLVGRALLRPLEARFAPLGEPLPTVGFVVSVGSGYRPHDGIPVTAALDEDGLARIVEAVRLLRELPDARLVVSGGAPAGQPPVALGAARLARALGVPQQALLVCDRPLDTAAEAREVAQLLNGAPFILVTSAYHMPRAMLLMRRAGARPIAAPTSQRAFGTSLLTWSDFVPRSGGLRDTELALHEYLGLAAIAVGL